MSVKIIERLDLLNTNLRLDWRGTELYAMLLEKKTSAPIAEYEVKLVRGRSLRGQPPTPAPIEAMTLHEAVCDKANRQHPEWGFEQESATPPAHRSSHIRSASR